MCAIRRVSRDVVNRNEADYGSNHPNLYENNEEE